MVQIQLRCLSFGCGPCDLLPSVPLIVNPDLCVGQVLSVRDQLSSRRQLPKQSVYKGQREALSSSGNLVILISTNSV